MKSIVIIILIVNSLVIPLSSYAGNVYKWVDENGRTHFSQKPPESNSNTAKQIKIKAPSLSQLEADSAAREKLKIIKEKWHKEIKDKRKREKSRYDYQQSVKKKEKEKKKNKQKADRKSKEIWDKRVIAECKRRKGVNCKTAVDARRGAYPVGSDDRHAGAEERRYKRHNAYRGIDKKRRCAYGYLEDCKKK